MAYSVQVAGQTLVKVGTGAAGALENLGFTRDGVSTTREAFWLDVPGDENGGDQGPPVEIQYLGEICRIRCELTKFDAAVSRKVSARAPSATAGVPMSAGTLMFAPAAGGTNAMRVLLYNLGGPANFPRAIPRMPIEVNLGTKFSTLLCEFEAHRDNYGVLYDTQVS